MKMCHRTTMAAVALLLAAGFATCVFAARTAAGAKGQKNAAFIIIQTGEDYEVAPQAELQQRKKAAAEKHKQDMKDYKARKAEAAKNKEKFTEPPPKAVVPKKVGPTFKTKEQAQEFLEKLLREKEEQAKKK